MFSVIIHPEKPLWAPSWYFLGLLTWVARSDTRGAHKHGGQERREEEELMAEVLRSPGDLLLYPFFTIPTRLVLAPLAGL